MNWPKYFPENCPPQDAATPWSVDVYMLVSAPIVPEDFQTLSERVPDQTFPTVEMRCQAHGLSVFTELEHVQRVQRRISRLRHKVIGQSTLTTEMGVMKPTHSQFGNSHRTWWMPVAFKPWQYFKIWKQEG